MTDQYRQGTAATLLAQFYAYAGGPAADVTGLTITISPTGGGAAVVGPTSSGVTHESTGLYSYAWAVDADQDTGTYVVEWAADGGVTAAETVEVVEASATTYATTTELKARLGISDTDEDTQLGAALSTASRWIEAHCRRQFNKATTASARLYYPTSRCLVQVDDFHTTSDLEIAVDAGADGTFEATLAAAQYELHPLNGIVSGEAGWPYREIRTLAAVLPTWTGRASVQVTARWGWAAVPAGVKEACLIIAQETFKLKDTYGGQAGFGDMAMPVRRAPQALDYLRPYRIDPVLVA